MKLVISNNGINMIKGFEKLVYCPYQPIKNDKWTIGYGHTSGVTENSPCISKAEAEEYLKSDINVAESSVYRNVTISLKQNQFDALVSLIFNVGSKSFANSKMLKKLNAGNIKGAADEFDDWTKGGLPDLVKRRAREKEVFLYGY